ncbi:YdcF family protein [Defluviitalea saccharophila]|uniref:YdcF family protein n=1 Tax=Defluviitalea saccharophila TaxID=879970 RepID=A0ABZ2Y658_9FIRM|nr:YdcF family protein [Candidatus Epulonipiscium sp.]
MIYFFRFLVLFGILNLISLYLLDSGVGMVPVWLGIIIGSFVLSINQWYQFFFSHNWIKELFLFGMIFFCIIECLIIINGFKTSIHTKSDYIIVLGARVRGRVPSLTLKNRLDKAYEYLIKHPETIAVLSGGQGPGEDISEGEAMREYLVKKGIEKERLIIEHQSTNTEENMRYSFQIIDEKKKDAKVIVVTSRFHILRSKMLAREIGKKVEGIGVNTMPYLIPTYYLREFFAVIKECGRLLVKII